jgi:hypothetical protein
MTRKEYNGWTNYETWVVALWMDNEQGSQSYWEEVATEYMDADNAEDNDTNGLAERLKSEHEEALPEVQGFAADLLGAAMSEVDWYEIAEHLLADAKENAA